MGLSYTTLAAPVIARMPAVYELLPPQGVPCLVDHDLQPLAADLHDVETWRRFGWGPFAPAAVRRLSGLEEERERGVQPRSWPRCWRGRAALHRALARAPEHALPHARADAWAATACRRWRARVVPEKQGRAPRFEPRNRTEADAMYRGRRRPRDAGQRPRLAPATAEDDPERCGIPEASRIVIGSADHHGIYREATFQSIVLRALLRPEQPLAAPLTDEEAEIA